VPRQPRLSRLAWSRIAPAPLSRLVARLVSPSAWSRPSRRRLAALSIAAIANPRGLSRDRARRRGRGFELAVDLRPPDWDARFVMSDFFGVRFFFITARCAIGPGASGATVSSLGRRSQPWRARFWVWSKAAARLAEVIRGPCFGSLREAEASNGRWRLGRRWRRGCLNNL